MRFLRRLQYLLRARTQDDALREEMEFHRARVQADLEAGGMPPDQAAAASRRAMGNTTVLREEAQDVWLVRWADRLARDVRYAVRGLRREPTFALTAILTLTLGVGATTTVFSVVDAELWRPLPYPDSDRLAVAFVRGPGRGRVEPISEATFDAWRAGAPAFEALAASESPRRVTLMLDVAESVVVEPLTSNYFATLTRPLLAGRTFSADDRSGPQVAVLTERTWDNLFARDPSVVGRTLQLDARPVTVVGVVANDDTLGPDADLFVNLDAASESGRDRSDTPFWNAVGRLAPGADAGIALQQLEAATARLAGVDRERWDGRAVHLETLGEFYAGNNWRPLYFLFGAAVLVLVLTMVNVASLLLARALRRTREFALRGALGGGPAALSRQLVVEGAVLALPAGALALLLATWAVGIITAQMPPEALVRGSQIPIDARAALFTLGMTGITAVAFGLTPLVVARRVDPGRLLGSGGRTGSTAVEGRVRAVLLAAQLTLTVVLLAGAGLFVRSFVALASAPLGFDPSGAAAARVVLPSERYASDEAVRGHVDRLLEAANAAPGVMRAAVGTSSPLGSGPVVNIVNPGLPAPAPGEEPRAIVRSVTPAFFETLGIPIVRGRAFESTDVEGAPRVAILNEYVAGVLFGESDPIGRTIDLLPGRGPLATRPGAVTVVGVAHDVREVGINEVSFGGLYLPFAQMPATSFELIALGAGTGAGIVADLRRAATAVDPTVPVIRATTFAQRIDDALQGDRFNLMLIAAFAALAILLAGIGTYGAVAYAVQTRTREFGVRMAFGARPAQLVGTAVRQAFRVAVVAGLAGLGVTVLIARLSGDAFYLVPGSHNGILYQVSMTDPLVLGAAVAGIIAVVLASAAVPARRAAYIDPVRALRAD